MFLLFVRYANTILPNDLFGKAVQTYIGILYIYLSYWLSEKIWFCGQDGRTDGTKNLICKSLNVSQNAIGLEVTVFPLKHWTNMQDMLIAHLKR